jgi:hypothetical protein
MVPILRVRGVRGPVVSPPVDGAAHPLRTSALAPTMAMPPRIDLRDREREAAAFTITLMLLLAI